MADKTLDFSQFDGKNLVPSGTYDLRVTVTKAAADEYVDHERLSLRVSITSGPYAGNFVEGFHYLDPNMTARDGEDPQKFAVRRTKEMNKVQQLWLAAHAGKALGKAGLDDIVAGLQSAEVRGRIRLTKPFFMVGGEFYKEYEDIPESDRKNAREIDEKNTITAFMGQKVSPAKDARAIAKGTKAKGL